MSEYHIIAKSLDLGELLRLSMMKEDSTTVEDDFGLGSETSTLGKRGASPARPLESTCSVPLPKKTYRNYKRAMKRKKEKESQNKQVKERTINMYVQEASPVGAAYFEIARGKAEESGYRGYIPRRNRDDTLERKEYTINLLEIEYPKLKIVRTGDGVRPRPILDKDGKLLAVFCGRPADPGYLEATVTAYNEMVKISNKYGLETTNEVNRRGAFTALNVGISYGQGQEEPRALKLKTPRERDIYEDLRRSEQFPRIAGYGSSNFKIWAPRVYDYYSEHLTQLYEALPHLKEDLPFPNTIFTAATFNFGKVVCYKHRDMLNCPFGYCAITAFGEFDSSSSGHLVLWEPQIAIEFPAGSTVLIPSATITHSNTVISQGEKRMSFTQYCAGGLFRFVDNGFQTDNKLEQEDPDVYKKLMDKRKTGWADYLKLISTFEEVKGSAPSS